ncbi:hypothetical protein SynSYN20_01678 [Synechococcus sp. SYN20]|uniref:hypothetical protein n=1 Tax=Synechococcus sp. SYN20 TaxID=1050714 RepID=UPI00164515B5|nr:hypothetical protein [Synechococcus sp. SYN20]QNJ26005.1 hypothetical protein SynSYN20_01678 [Synechococcus sp. SYN20]
MLGILGGLRHFTMSTVFIYDLESGKGHKVYPASVQAFLATGRYSLDKPANGKLDDSAFRSELPSAGREAERPRPADIAMAAKNVEAKVEEKTEEVKEILEESSKPEAKRAPRRRSAE